MSNILSLHTNEAGLKTLLRNDLDETYHSRHGAIAESLYVFIEQGLRPLLNSLDNTPIHLLEVGFGTGLNAMLTLIEAAKSGRKIWYEALETLPLTYPLVEQLEYHHAWDDETQSLFSRLHAMPWNEACKCTVNFTLTKHEMALEQFHSKKPFDLIFFDAFAPEKQPELWTEERFTQLFDLLAPGGVLVTYSAKGEVRRTMQRCGFVVERLPGPPMKRHMLRAQKPNP